MPHFATTRFALAFLPLLAGAGPSMAAEEAIIAEALSAAPPQLKDSVAVRDLAGNLLREGDGRFTCFPSPEGFAGPMCLDSEWQRWMGAFAAREPFEAEGIGIAYMMAGDSPAGGASNIDPFAAAPTADNEWVVDGPHVMIITPDAADLDGLPTDKDVPGPYVMWSGTDYAHVMLRLGERPEQRRAE